MQWWCSASGVPWDWKWDAYPGVWIFVIAIAFAFSRVQARWGTEEDGRRPFYFYAAVVVIWIALDWPVGALAAGYLTSVKMVQYLLLSLIAPPLILIGLPRGLYRSLMASRVRGVVTVVTHPLIAMSFFVAIMALTHWAYLVDTLMVLQVGSFAMDTLWIMAGLLFWWPVSAPLPERSWLGDPARVGYLITATLVNTGVFAYLTFAELPLYAIYELAPPVTGLSTRDDQRLAGLLMKIGGAVIFWTAISIIFFRWANREVTMDGRDHVKTVGLALLVGLSISACGGSEAGAPGELGAEIAAVEAELSPEPQITVAVAGRPLTPGRAALYLTITNGSDTELVVAAIEIEGVGRASVHETRMDGGQMSMRPVEELRVPAGQIAKMEPGGLHIMLEEIADGFFDQGSFLVSVRLLDGRTLEAEAIAVPLADLEGALTG